MEKNIEKNNEQENNPYKTAFELITTVILNQNKNRIENLKEALIKLKQYTGSSNIAIYKKDDRFNIYEQLINIEKDFEEKTKVIINEYISSSKQKLQEVDLKVNSEEIKRINIMPIFTTDDKNYLMVLINNNMEDFNKVSEIINKAMDTILTDIERIIELDKIGKRDPLTGLENRMAYDQKMQELHENGELQYTTYTIADLFKLKSVNDEIGHEAGDDYIIACAKALSGTFLASESGEDSFVYRIGGDEFAILSLNSDIEDVNEKMRIANDYIKALLMKYNHLNYNFEINYGSFHSTGEPINPKIMYLAADKKLSESKRETYGRLGIDRRR